MSDPIDGLIACESCGALHSTNNEPGTTVCTECGNETFSVLPDPSKM
jgi:predicted  nucleic acid-binding Zn-ribbon protein